MLEVVTAEGDRNSFIGHKAAHRVSDARGTRAKGAVDMIGKAMNLLCILLSFLFLASHAQAGYMGAPAGSIGGLFLLMVLIALLFGIFIVVVLLISWMKSKIKKWVSGWK